MCNSHLAKTKIRCLRNGACGGIPQNSELPIRELRLDRSRLVAGTSVVLPLQRTILFFHSFILASLTLEGKSKMDEQEMDVDSDAQMRAMMGFSSFGSQKPGKPLSPQVFYSLLLTLLVLSQSKKMPKRKKKAKPQVQKLNSRPVGETCFLGNAVSDTYLTAPAEANLPPRPAFANLSSPSQVPYTPGHFSATSANRIPIARPLPQSDFQSRPQSQPRPQSQQRQPRGNSHWGSQIGWTSPDTGETFTNDQLRRLARGEETDANGEQIYFKPSFVDPDPWKGLVARELGDPGPDFVGDCEFRREKRREEARERERAKGEGR